MNKKYLTAMFCMFLIIMFPVCFAETYEETGESLIIEVKEQQPRILRQALIEDQNAPVVLVLGAIRSTPFLTLPEIESVSVRVIRRKDMAKLIDQNVSIEGTSDQDLNYLTGTQRFYKAKFPTLDNLGFLKLDIKKIEQGQKIPEQIDLDMEAKIKYEAERTGGEFLGGGSTLEALPEETEEQTKANRNDRIILGGRAYLRAAKITDEKATIYVYGADLDNYNSIGAVEEGQISRSVSIPGETGEYKNIRIRIDKITGREQAVLNVEGVQRNYDEGEEIKEAWTVERIDINQGYIRLSNPKFKMNVYLANVQGFKTVEDLKKKTENCQDNIKIYDNSKVPSLEDIRYSKAECDDFGIALIDLEQNDITGLVKFKGTEEKPAAIIKTEKHLERRYYEDESIGEGKCNCKISTIREDMVNIKVENVGTPGCGEEKIIPFRIGDSKSVCGDYITLKNIETRKRVSVSVLPGTGKGETTSYFSIHLPIEKRAIQYTPMELAAKLNRTQQQIDNLNKTITSLETLVNGWTKVCLAVAAIFVVTSFFKGFGAREAEKKKDEAETKPEDFVLAPPQEGGPTLENLQLKYYDANTGKWVSVKPGELEGLYKSQGSLWTKEGKDSKLQIGMRLKGIENGQEVSFRISDDGTLEKISQYDGNFQGGDKSNRDQIKVSKDYNTIALPLKDCNMLAYIPKKQCEAWKNAYGGALYVVYNHDDPDWLHIVWGGSDGNYILFNDGTAKYDRVLATMASNSKEGELWVKQFARIREASQRGDPKITVGGQKYNLNPKGSMKNPFKEKTDCETVFSAGQCKILFNACDPVMCPPSRCDFGGKYQVPNVINSGLVGSLLLCLPNIKQGVIMPVCLTGLLNAFRKIQINLQAYANCLEEAMVYDRTVGICDRLWSIFMCQIIWENVMTLLGLTGGLTGGIINKGTGKGGGEYLGGIGDGVANAKKSIDYFTNSYATTVFASYRARSSEELGETICKSAIYGKTPFLGDITEEVTKGQNPPQFTAYVEEQSYSSIAHISEYKVWFNIYSGAQDVTWKVYLQKDGKIHSIDSGTLAPAEFVDRSPDFTAEPGFKEICVVINGQPKCGFGKLVSTSFGMTAVHDWVLQKELSRNIQTQEQCLKDTTGYMPEAQVEKVCSTLNPYSGKGENQEKLWTKIGTCGEKQGVSLGFCWMKTGDLAQDNPVLYKETLEDMCAGKNGKVCGFGQICDGNKVLTPVSSGYQEVECCFGECVADEARFEKVKDQVEAIAKKDPLYQKMYKEGYRVCSELGSTDPFEDTEGVYGWTTREKEIEKEDEKSETRAELYYFKGAMYLLCESCDKAREEFLKISREFETTKIWRERACGASDVGGLMKDAGCKDSCIIEKEPTPGKSEEGGGVGEVVEKIMNFIKGLLKGDTQETLVKDDVTKISSGGKYELEITFGKDVTSCAIKLNEEAVVSKAEGKICKSEQPVLILGDSAKIQVAAECKECKEKFEHTFSIENTEKKVISNDPNSQVLLCKIQTLKTPYYFCLATSNERCSDYKRESGGTEDRASLSQTYSENTLGNLKLECDTTCNKQSNCLSPSNFNKYGISKG